MRKIKFRAWENGQMYLDVQNSYDTVSSIYGQVLPKDQWNNFGEVIGLYEEDQLILMQFTGLHDKNGKEIYEGDILNLEVSASGVGSPLPGKYWIEYFADGFKLTTYMFGEKVWYPGASYPNGRTEVIGDIYSTPELLNART